MDNLQRLIAMEDIRHLKARYWQAVDLKDAELLRSVFTDDAVIDLRAVSWMSDAPSKNTPSPDQFVAHCLGSLASQDTVHHGHTPQISFKSDSEATGMWPMEDNLWPKDPETAGYTHFQGHGIYFDTYRKAAAGWLISATTLKRLHISRK